MSCCFLFFKQKTAYEIRIIDWSSDVALTICGSIIHMSSQMGHVGGARRTLYCASKWAVEGLSKAMALDLAPHKIRVNTIAPTFIETAMTAPFFQDETFK